MEKQYLTILQNILNKGYTKPTRTGIDTLSISNVYISHDLSDGFPLLTTRKIPWKSLRIELEGFIKGICSKNWYKDRGCNYWNNWSNPYNNPIVDDDLGPIYGFQWRKFDEIYSSDDDGHIAGYDQLKNIVDTLKTNPNDRRMVCSSWNPNQQQMMALPPCVYTWGIVHNNGVLNLYYTQRSCDFIFGAPSNIAEYALLLHLLCKETNMKPGNLSCLIGDCHIYKNQIHGAEEQLSRNLGQLPSITILNKNKLFSIFDWTYDQVKLSNYNPQQAIKFGRIAT